MSTSEHIQASVERIAIPAAPEGLQHLAAAVLAGHTTLELRSALQIAAEVRSRSSQRTWALQQQAEDLKIQLAQIERQLAG